MNLKIKITKELVLILLSVILLSNKILGQEYYKQGTDYLIKNDYFTADSLLSLSICNFETSNAYFNRAVARINIGDTCGACDDLSEMSFKYLDKESTKLFQQFCCHHVDTVYYDKGLKETNSQEYKYYAISRFKKYDSIVTGTMHKKNSSIKYMSIDMGCNMLRGFSEMTTDIIGFYYISGDERRIYTMAYNKPTIFNEKEMDNYKYRAKIFFNSKYNKLKSDNDIENLEVYVTFIVNQQGDVEDASFSGLYPEINLGDLKTDFIKDVISTIYSIPRFKPAKIAGQNIDYLQNYTLSF